MKKRHKNYNFRIPYELISRVRELAKEMKTTPSDLVRRGLDLVLEKHMKTTKEGRL